MRTSTRSIILWGLGLFAFFAFIFLIRSMLLPFVIGMGLAYLLDPAADRLEKWGMSRFLATSTIILGFFLVIGVALAFLIPAMIEQFHDFAIAFPQYLATLKTEYGPRLTRMMQSVTRTTDISMDSVTDQAKDYLMGSVSGFALGVMHKSMNFINLLSLILLTPVVAFYLLRDWDRLVAHVDGLLPRNHIHTIREQAREIDRTLSGFVRGQLLVCLLLGSFYAIGLALVGLNFSIVIGLLTGLLSIIPFVGVFAGLLTGVIVAIIQFGEWQSVAMVAGVFMLGQFLEGNFVTPKLVGERVNLHPLWIIFGMLVGGTLFGFVGILIAVPVTAVIGVLVRFSLRHYRESAVYHGGEPAKLYIDAPDRPIL